MFTKALLATAALAIGASAQGYSASFTEYGSTDDNGSGNCNVATTACGYYTSPGYSAAVSQNEFGVGPGEGAGPACGTCWKLTIETDSSGNAVSNAGNSIVVKVTNLCPADGNPLCAQSTLSSTNQYGANLNFDTCIDSGASSALFGSSGVGLGVGTATEVDCSEWSGSVPLEESDADAQPNPKRGQTQHKQTDDPKESGEDDGAQEPENEDATKDKEIDDKQLHEYVCIDPPYWCKGGGDEDDDDDEEQEDGEQDSSADKSSDETKEGEKESLFPKPASEHPEHNFVMMWQSWTSLCDYMRRASYTNPDLFDMYIYNDSIDLPRSQVAEFDKAKNKHTTAKDTATLYDMWAPLATLGHYVSTNDVSTFQMMDDGERTCQLIGLIGCAFVTMLDTLDNEGELKASSQYRDLGLVISLFLKWSSGQEAYGIDDEQLEWRPLLIAYAKKAGIDLKAVGCDDIGEILEENVDDSEAKIPTSKGERYKWAKKLKEYKAQHTSGGKLGGDSYDITKMSRKQRAGYAFDKKDPLADVSDKDLREGNLAFA
ncbi:hypothetical protein LTR85_002975 [Meristemomyces frigidus]|nr:hypothetical protein LTR85_002975 [Meristemomyces frigidus]